LFVTQKPDVSSSDPQRPIRATASTTSPDGSNDPRLGDDDPAPQLTEGVGVPIAR
jgi:hypothetical protein